MLFEDKGYIKCKISKEKQLYDRQPVHLLL